MDWIQWYLAANQIVILILMMVANNMRVWAIATIISLPYVGRVYGWW